MDIILSHKRLVGKPGRRRPRGRPMRRWKNNIIINLIYIWDRRVRAGFNWLRIEVIVGLLRTR
jgi:hypothetical protein